MPDFSVELISLHSFSGGVGKSHLAAGLALAKSGEDAVSVVIDTDVTGLGHLNTIYRSPSAKSYSFWNLACSTSTPLALDTELLPLTPPIEEKPSLTDTIKDGDGACYYVLPNLPASDPFPINAREVVLSSYYSGFAVVNLARIITSMANQCRKANKKTLTIVIDCSPFITALAEEVFVWMSYLRLNLLESSGAPDFSGCGELLVEQLAGANYRELEGLSLTSAHPYLVVLPDVYMGYPLDFPKGAKSSDNPNGLLVWKAMEFIRSILDTRLRNSKAKPEKFWSILNHLAPLCVKNDQKSSDSLLLFNRVSKGTGKGNQFITIAEEDGLSSRVERRALLFSSVGQTTLAEFFRKNIAVKFFPFLTLVRDPTPEESILFEKWKQAAVDLNLVQVKNIEYDKAYEMIEALFADVLVNLSVSDVRDGSLAKRFSSVLATDAENKALQAINAARLVCDETQQKVINGFLNLDEEEWQSKLTEFSVETVRSEKEKATSKMKERLPIMKKLSKEGFNLGGAA